MSRTKHATTLGLLRPRSPWLHYGNEVWHYGAALALAVAGIMVIAFATAFSGAVASWVSDLTDPAKAAVVESRTGRIEAYQAWLFPFFFLGLALVLTGISVALWGVVRRIWIRVQALDEALPHLKRQR
jgi:hypothetical protein